VIKNSSESDESNGDDDSDLDDFVVYDGDDQEIGEADDEMNHKYIHA